jgi:hypothetical protein
VSTTTRRPDLGPLDQLACDSADQRRAATLASALNGIDYLEVDPTDQRTLSVHFLKPLPGQPGGVPAAPALTEANVSIEGGVRIRGIEVTSVANADDTLTVTVNRPGDFSTYALRLVSSADDADPPAGFDFALAAIAFSFKVTCPTTFDCAVPAACPPTDEPTRIDYLAKDYDSFLRLELDRLATTVPDWRDTNAADAQETLLELFAYVADHLSYQQDVRGTEAYLTTARSRVSVRRHARLLDYRPGDGCSARTWVTFDVLAGSAADGSLLPAGSRVLTGEAGADVRLDPARLDEALRAGPVVFETLTPVALAADRNAVAFYTWSEDECCLPAGSTEATLVDAAGVALQPGDVVVLEEIAGPATGLAADADPGHRHPVRLTSVRALTDDVTGLAVREIVWASADALPFPLQLTSRPDPGGPPVAVSVARANVALADHGLTLENVALGVAPEDVRPWRPIVPVPELARAVPLAAADTSGAAAAANRLDPGRAIAAFRLSDGSDPWDPLPDLLGASGDTKAVVVELERDGTSVLRFGDDTNGARPGAGTMLTFETVRTGTGSAGNVGNDVLSRVVSPLSGFTRVANPLAAVGGADAEDIESIRRAAPAAFLVRQRAVTEADWIEVTERRTDVQRAAARIRWTGSWYTVMVMIDRVGGLDVTSDPAFLTDVETYLNRFRVAGYDLTVRDPIWVPIDLAMLVCADPEHFQSDVERGVRAALGSQVNSDGSKGLFHPDNLTFGQPVFVSAIVAAASAVDGVSKVVVKTFHQFGKTDAGEITAGVLAVSDVEVARLDDDPNFPENGRLDLEVQGGR